MKRLLGFILLGLSTVSVLFFRKYNGTVIPYPLLWYALFIVIGFLGVTLIYKSMVATIRIAEKQSDNARSQFKNTGERIKVDFDSSSFHSRSYQHQVPDDRLEVTSIHLFSSLIPNPERNEIVSRSSISFTFGKEVFVSSFNVDAVTLRSYVIQEKLFVYVNRNNRLEYVFDLE